MKYCKDCEHVNKWEWGPFDSFITYYCKHEKADNYSNTVTGETPTCDEMRVNENACGKYGRWFEPKSEAKELKRPAIVEYPFRSKKKSFWKRKKK